MNSNNPRVKINLTILLDKKKKRKKKEFVVNTQMCITKTICSLNAWILQRVKYNA